MTTATISPERQIEIPKALLDQLDLHPGAQLEMDVVGESLVMKLAALEEFSDWCSLEGMAAGGESLTQALEEERAADKAHDEARVKGH